MLLHRFCHRNQNRLVTGMLFLWNYFAGIQIVGSVQFDVFKTTQETSCFADSRHFCSFNIRTAQVNTQLCRVVEINPIFWTQSAADKLDIDYFTHFNDCTESER